MQTNKMKTNVRRSTRQEKNCQQANQEESDSSQEDSASNDGCRPVTRATNHWRADSQLSMQVMFPETDMPGSMGMDSLMACKAMYHHKAMKAHDSVTFLEAMQKELKD